MRVWCIPLLHPSFIMRGNYREEPAQVVYLKRAKEISTNGWSLFDPAQPPNGANLNPTVGEILEWSPGDGVVVDIESAGRRIRCIGLCRLADLYSICIPFFGQGGVALLSAERLSSVKARVRDILYNPDIAKWFHNGLGFDIPILKHNGFRVRGYAGDTIFMHHIAYPEMRKGLKYLSNLYLGKGDWKSLVTEDDEGEDK